MDTAAPATPESSMSPSTSPSQSPAVASTMDAHQLHRLGLSGEAAEAYLTLLAQGSRRVIPPEPVRAELAAAGLLGESGDEGVWLLNDPRQVLRAVARRHRRQAEAVLHLEHQLGSLWDRPTESGTEIVEVLHGRSAVTQVADSSQLAVRHEVRSLDRGPYSPSTAGEMCPIQRQMLPRGIRYRTVYGEDAAAAPDIRRAIGESVDLGEEARVHAAVPMRLRLMDDDLGLIVLNEEERVTGVVVHPSPLLDALIGLFDSIWATSVPLGVADDIPHLDDVDGQTRQLLRLMASGLTDEHMARELGISRRTLSRRVQDLLERTGARTRFQLGVQAARRGWLV
ncbi:MULTISPECIES: helix-turn-helix transcriptional regulator [Actinomycetes]|uniref:HTH luxR-type domain-containing protein n=3 Tax=Actinomycetes TaxID=1760 RepID=A0ABP6LVP3_9MICC